MPDERFARTRMLLGSDALDVLAKARVAVFGVGGVGGYAAEALVRSGIGAIEIVDKDRVDITNVNRQIIATDDTIGHSKVSAMAQRLGAINPNCQIRAHECFYLPDTKNLFDLSEYDYVVDAVDTVTAKLLIIEEADRCGVALISSMGAANKLDPTAFEVADIYETSVCPLAKVVRKECRKRGIAKLKVVYSREPARTPFAEEQLAQPGFPACPTESGGGANGNRPVPGSVSFVPPVAGLIIAGEVVKDLIGFREP